MKINVGIDLGTTYSAVAHFLKDSGLVEIFKNGDNKECTPSVVCIEGGRVIIGDEAKEEQKSGNINTAAFYKSMMGNPYYTAYLDGDEYSAETLSAKFLAEMVKDIERSNNVQIEGAVITVPAYFNEKQRQATIRAGEAAGLKVLKIINEPTAAIIAYGLTSGADKNVMVYDLGGGTFDITIARVHGTEIDVIATNGNHELGGKNWDAALLDYIQDQFESEYGIRIEDHPEDYKELQVKCEEAKKRLTQVSSTTVMIQCDGMTGKYDVTREYFDEATSALLGETLMLIDNSFQEITEAQGKVFGWKDIDEVVLVGGSTRMPQIREMIIREYGKPPVTKDINVDTIVATGAAMQAELCISKTISIGTGSLMKGAGGAAPAKSAPNMPKMTLTISNSNIRDITSHSLGMLALASDETTFVNSIIIKKNSYVNEVFSKEYNFSGDKLEVYVMQGESRDPYDCEILGKYEITGMPKGNKEKLSVNFLYNSNGVVEVNANMANGTPLVATRRDVTETLDEIIARLRAQAEEAKRQAAAAANIEVIIAIDTSGSMSGDSIKQARASAIEFVKEFDLKHTYVSVMSFADRILYYCEHSNDQQKIIQAVKQVDIGQVGFCNCSVPIKVGSKDFHSKDAARVLVVLTDGVWTHQNSEVKAADAAKQDGILIYGIGIGGADKEFLDKISSTKGKKVDLSRLTVAFKEVASSIATEIGGASLK